MNIPGFSGTVAVMSAVDVEFEQLWLPLWPFAADDYAQGIYRMARGDALQRRYVQTNPDAFSNLLVIDIDHSDSALRALSAARHHPMPTAVVENAHNGHAHAVWALSEPVTRTEYARRRPLAYAAAVTEGLRRAVDGDKGYNGLLTKNPTHDDWQTHWFGPRLRSLGELEADLGTLMPPKDWRRSRARHASPVGLSRNCSLFESARHWAYREVRCHFGDAAGLSAAIHEEAVLRNLAFAEPLPGSEVRAIAASISRWITTKSRMWVDGPIVYDATFSAIQSARGRKPRPQQVTTDNKRAANRTHGFQPTFQEAAMVQAALR